MLKEMPLIDVQLNSCRLRTIVRSDAQDIALHANNKKIARYMRDRFPHPYTLNDAHQFLEVTELMKKTKQIIVGIEVEGVLAGAVGLHPQGDIYRKSAELGYWLGEPYWGRGIITEAVQWISDYAFSHYEYIRLFAGVFPDNVASKKVLEKCGYALECIRTKALVKYDTIYDEWVYVKFKPEA